MKKITKKNNSRQILSLVKIIALLQFLSGLVLLCYEITDCIRLPNIQQIDSQFGGLVDLTKYQESCYKNLFLYTLLLISGVSFWINRKLYWGLTQVLWMTMCVVGLLNLFHLRTFHFVLAICLGFLFLLSFIYIGLKIYNRIILQAMGISEKIKWIFIFAGIISCVIWVLLLIQW